MADDSASKDKFEKLTKEIESLNAMIKGKSKGGKNGQQAWQQAWKGGGKSGKGEFSGAGKGKGRDTRAGKGDGKGAGKGKRPLICHNCQGVGHPARLCPSGSQSFNEFEDEQPGRRCD